MVHAERDAKGLGFGNMDFTYGKNKLPFDEIYTTHIENKIRAQSGVPLRTHYIYSVDEGGTIKFPEWSRLLDWSGQSLYYGGYDYMQQNDGFEWLPMPLFKPWY